jgi:pimeloyl-ACP methyl ester carboxylesterase
LLHRFVFTTALTITSRVVQVRDHLLGRVPRILPECPEIRATRCSIPSGKNRLDAIFVEPVAEAPKTALLICHGIGETVPQWFAVQRLLAGSGIASLVFDYSGYGRSTGRIDWPQCEQDAVCAFDCLRRLAPSGPITLLGFSLGTGVAPAIFDRVQPERLVLCAGFTSFRKAARAAWIPPFLSFLVPPIWSAQNRLCNSTLPILIVQGDRDRLFGIQMARELVACCGGRADLLVLPARSHNYPVYHPQPEYWNRIAEWILGAARPQSANP